MPHPLTLLQISGRGYPPAPLRQSTLLIIDAQEEYRSGALRLPGLDAAAAEIGVLVHRPSRIGRCRRTRCQSSSATGWRASRRRRRQARNDHMLSRSGPWPVWRRSPAGDGE